jgi:hypothetical protein
MEATMQSHKLLLILLCVVLAAGSAQAGEAPRARKPFLHKTSAALLKVMKVGAGKVRTIDEVRVKEYPVSVAIVSRLPPGPVPTTPREILVRREIFELIISTDPVHDQDWFPLVAGGEIVVAFNGTELPREAKDLEPILAADCSAPAIWHDCTTFYQAISSKEKNKAAALARSLRAQSDRLSPVFFRLVEAYDSRLVADKAFGRATAAYLRNSAVLVAKRMRTLHWLSSQPDAETNKAMVAAIVHMIQDAEKAKVSDRLVDNTVMLWSLTFVHGQPRSALPRLEPPVRKELLTLVHSNLDQKSVLPLSIWLLGLVPGVIPLANGDVRKGVDEVQRDPEKTPKEAGGVERR